MEVELKEMLNDLESLKRSLTDPSHTAPIDKVCINSDSVAIEIEALLFWSDYVILASIRSFILIVCGYITILSSGISVILS